MKNKISKADVAVRIILGITLVWLLYVYSKLPDTIPTHFDMSGRADGYGPKITVYIIWAITLGVDLVIKIARKIDPKSENYDKFSRFFGIFRVVFALFMCGINIVVVMSALGSEINVTKITMPFMGILFIILGNYMPKVKPNYTFGIKTPWTLASENVWYLTHRKAGKIWIIGGIILILITVVFPAAQAFVLEMIIIVAIAVWPCVISYFEFLKEKESYSDEVDL